MKKNDALTNILFNILKTVINLLFPIIIFPYTSRVLGPENLGKVDFATSVVSYFSLFASMGIPAYGIIVCSRDRENRRRLNETVSELLFLNLVFTAIVEILLLICIYSIKRFYVISNLLLLNALNMIFVIIGMDWFFNAIEQYKYITIRSFMMKVVSLFLIFILVKENQDYVIFAAIIIFSTVGANLFNCIYSRHFWSLTRVNMEGIKRHIVPIMTYFGASIASTINSNTDLVMLGFLKNDTIVGLYSFSVKVKTILSSIVTAGLAVLIPQFTLSYAKKEIDNFRKLLRSTLLFAMMIAIGMTFFFIISTNEVISILGGNRYNNAKTSMIVLTLCVIVLGVTWTLGVGVLQACGKEKSYAKTITISCCVNIILNILLIPEYGHLGAAIATFCTEFVNMIFFFYYSKEIIGDSFHDLKLIFFFEMAMIASAVSLFVRSFISCENSILRFCIMGVSFFFFYFLSIFLIHKEVRSLLYCFLKGR